MESLSGIAASTVHSVVVQQSPPSPRVVALGGGTGLPVLLRGLKELLLPAAGSTGAARWERDRLTAIVTVADDGGSSGRLRP